MKLFLFTLWLSLVFQIHAIAQEAAVLLENAIEVKFELRDFEYLFLHETLIVKVHLKNITQDSIYILSNSCNGLERFFKCEDENTFILSRRCCTFNSPIVQTLLPKTSIEFELCLYLKDGIPQKEMNLGLEIVKIPKEKLPKHAYLYGLYEGQKDFENFVFWKKLEEYSFCIKIPLLRI